MKNNTKIIPNPFDDMGMEEICVYCENPCDHQGISPEIPYDFYDGEECLLDAYKNYLKEFYRLHFSMMAEEDFYKKFGLENYYSK